MSTKTRLSSSGGSNDTVARANTWCGREVSAVPATAPSINRHYFVGAFLMADAQRRTARGLYSLQSVYEYGLQRSGARQTCREPASSGQLGRETPSGQFSSLTSHYESAASRHGRTHERSVLTPNGGKNARKLQPDPGDGPVTAAQSGQAPAQQERSQQARPHPWKRGGGTRRR